MSDNELRKRLEDLDTNIWFTFYALLIFNSGLLLVVAWFLFQGLKS